MKIKQKITKIVFGALFVISVSLTASTSSFALNCGTTSDGTPIETTLLDCSSVANKDTNGDGVIDSRDTGVDNNGVWKLLIVAINILTAGIGIAGVGGIVYGGIRYATAGGNFENAKKALGIITNVGIGLVAYGLMFAVLNFIIPGGLFSK